MTPAVSVILPVYMGARYLSATIDGLRAQSFSDFEIVAVNDASPDESREILLSYREPRLVLIDNPSNLGQTVSMQRALDAARGRYVARQDQDDVSRPGRLARQVSRLDQQPALGVLGTGFLVIDEHGAPHAATTVSYPEESVAEMGWRLLFSDRLADSSVMFRTDVARRVGGFDPRYRYAQDFDLWSRMSAESGAGRLSDVLLELRLHRGSASVRHAGDHDDEAAKIIQRNISRVLATDIGPQSARSAHQALTGAVSLDPADVWRSVALLESTIEPYCRQRGCSRDDQTAIGAALVETLIGIAARNRRMLGLRFAALVARTVLKTPGRVLRPSRLHRWWHQGRVSRRQRAAVRDLFA